MNDYIRIYEVGPRDGLQNESTAITITQKLSLIKRLIGAGLREIEATSFVHPKAVPQMADADSLMSELTGKFKAHPVKIIGLVFNQRGYDRAIASGCRAMAFGVSVSDTVDQSEVLYTIRYGEACVRIAILLLSLLKWMLKTSLVGIVPKADNLDQSDVS